MEQRRIKRDPYKLVGTVLGRYKVQEMAGIGGMGVVYRAQHMVTRGFVALKILKPDLAINNPEMIKLFLEEAAKTVNLSHPYIIKVTDADIIAETGTDGTAFLVMEWLDGHTLEEELKQNGAMTLERVARLIEQICEAVAHAHDNGIIHRDLKPSNIMLVKDYRQNEMVKIVDFGIAKALTSTVGANSRIMGAPYYASPEQLIVGSAIDHRSDIYSLGVLSYQMMTGQLPFDSTSIDMMIRQTISVPPPPLRQFRPDVPDAVEEVVFRALAKRPQDRYQSVTEFARAVRQATSAEAGDLMIRCTDAADGETVPGASVYLNGRHVGETDDDGMFRRNQLMPGEHLIEIECLQYQPWKQHVHVNPREELHVAAEIAQKAVGDLVVKAPVSGAEVLLNGTKVGTTDEAGMLYLKDLTLGKVLVEVKYYRRYASVREAVILQGQQSHLEVELPPIARRNYLKEGFQKLGSFFAAPFRAAGRALPSVGGGFGRGLRSKTLLLTLLAAAAVASFAILAYKYLPAPGQVRVEPTPAAPTPTPPAPMPTPEPTVEGPKEVARTLTGTPVGLITTGCELCKVAVSRDGQMVASTGSDNLIRLWRAGEQSPFRKLAGAQKPGSSVAVSPDGNIVAAGDDGGAILLWRADGSLLRTLQAHDYVWDVRFSPDGQTIFSAEGGEPITIRLWNMSDGSLSYTLTTTKTDEMISVSPDLSTLALFSKSGQVRLWSVRDDVLLLTLDKENYQVRFGAFSPDGKLLAIASKDGAVRLWRVADGALAAELEGEPGEIGDVAFSADGRTLAAGMSSGAIRIWNVSNRRFLTTMEGHSKTPSSLSFSADGSVLASGSDDKTIRLWKLSEN